MLRDSRICLALPISVKKGCSNMRRIICGAPEIILKAITMIGQAAVLQVKLGITDVLLQSLWRNLLTLNICGRIRKIRNGIVMQRRRWLIRTELFIAGSI